MTYAKFNLEKSPLIIVEFTGEKAHAENFSDYLKGLDDIYAIKKNIAIVFDASKTLDLNPIYQLKQAKWIKLNKFSIERYCRGVAYIIPNRFLRNALGLIFKIQPNPAPFKVFETLNEGLAWAGKQLES